MNCALAARYSPQSPQRSKQSMANAPARPNSLVIKPCADNALRTNKTLTAPIRQHHHKRHPQRQTVRQIKPHENPLQGHTKAAKATHMHAPSNPNNARLMARYNAKPGLFFMARPIQPRIQSRLSHSHDISQVKTSFVLWGSPMPPTDL